MQEVPANLAEILDHVGDGVTVQDGSGRLVYANAEAARALGYASAAEFLAAPIADLVARYSLFDEDEQPFPWERLPGRRALQGEREPSATIRFRDDLGGDERWSVVRSSPIVDEAGRVKFVVNVWQDATVQKRREAEQQFLAQAGEALAASLDVETTLTNIARLAVPRLADWSAIHLVREDGTVSQLAVAHVDPERVAWALQLQERYPPDPDADQGVYKVIRTGRSEIVPVVSDAMLVAAARDGEQLAMLRRIGFTSALVVPMLIRGRAVGAITFASAESGHHYDDADRELAEELARRAALAVENARLYDAERDARQEAEEAQVRFRVLFEQAPDAILVVNAAGRFIEANASASRMLGYSFDELLVRDLDDLTPQSEAAILQFAAFPEGGEWRAESELVRKDGSRVPVEIWSRRLEFPDGPIGIAVVRDISERIAADQIREEVISAISHDLRSPLGSIKLQAQGLLRSLRRGAAPELDRLEQGLAAIDSMTVRVASLLDDIVDVARDRGPQGVPFAPEPTDLVALAERCVDEVRAASGRDVRVTAMDEPVVGEWDPRGIERVILNLLTNSVKYSPAGGTIVVEVGRRKGADGERAVLAVEDRGIGIPAPDLERIFERYRRGRNVGSIAGTGVGLTGARQIVERHGGTIEIESEEGRGTRAAVRLPLATAQEADDG